MSTGQLSVTSGDQFHKIVAFRARTFSGTFEKRTPAEIYTRSEELILERSLIPLLRSFSPVCTIPSVRKFQLGYVSRKLSFREAVMKRGASTNLNDSFACNTCGNSKTVLLRQANFIPRVFSAADWEKTLTQPS